MVLSTAPALVLIHRQGRDSEISLGKQAEDGCTLFCGNLKPCFFSLSLYMCHGKNEFHLAHQQDDKALTQLF